MIHANQITMLCTLNYTVLHVNYISVKLGKKKTLNPGCMAKFEFQIISKFIFSTSMSHVISGNPKANKH